MTKLAIRKSELFQTPSMCVLVRVTSPEQLKIAEFSGESVRPKVYDNGCKNVLGI